eukprot:7388254-Prymnesium_polylepis.1
MHTPIRRHDAATCGQGLAYCAAQFKDAGCALPQRLEAKVEPKEGDAKKECHEHASLLGLSGDHQNPSRQRQLAAHLEWLPQEDKPHFRVVVAPQEGSRAAQRRWPASAERIAVRPQQHRVEQGNPHWP